MTTFTGNQAVRHGYYLNGSTFAIEPVAQDGAILPAGPGRWHRIPTVVALLATPIAGLAFLMFLPLIGFCLFAYAVARRLTGHVAEGATSLAATVSPDLAAGAAYLTGAKGDEKAPAGAHPELERLEKEISSKRAE